MTDEELRDEWDSGLSEEEIAAEYGVPVDEVRYRRRRVLRLRRRPVRHDPSEEEIWGRLTKEIQAGWSEATRDSRRVGPPEKAPWTLPVVPADDLEIEDTE